MEARKYSKKREAILEALRNTTEHPSAEMLYARLKPEFPDLSLGTVYRNLAMFIRDGDAVSVGTVAGQERYDADTHPHAHFICSECGRVLDVCCPCLSALDKEVERETGGAVSNKL
jgi:Fur family peroxide stress response transcriptional regulator